MKYRNWLATAVAVALAGTCLGATGAGAWQPDELPTAQEISHAALSQRAATESMVLLENANGALPIPASGNIALFGVGAYRTVKGGTGSGAVNNRYTLTVQQGFDAAGYSITTSDAYWNALTTAADALGSGGGMFGGINYSAAEQLLTKASVLPKVATDTAIFVLARNSGEGSDRTDAKGDYYLTDIESANITLIGKTYRNVIVVLNVGGIVDTTFVKEINGSVTDPIGETAIDSLLLMSQAGQESGPALVEVLNGTVTPSGHLADTWASDYQYYPASNNFGTNDGNAVLERYSEDVFVGYRFFDTFDKAVSPYVEYPVVSYPFGFGASYTTFTVIPGQVTASLDEVTVKATVVNTGDTYSGKDVVQVYYSAPGVNKPYQELIGFAKTDLLAPGQAQELTITFDPKNMASYNESQAAWVLDSGKYVIRVGDSSRNTQVASLIQVPSRLVTEQLANEVIGPLQPGDPYPNTNPAWYYSYPTEAAEIAAAKVLTLQTAGFKAPNNASDYEQTVVIPTGSPYASLDRSLLSTITARIPASQSANWDGTGAPYVPKLGETVETIQMGNVPANPTLYDVYKGTITMDQFVASLSVTELANIVEGSGIGTRSTLVAPGSAGYTTALYESKGIAGTTLADGPAGLRITQHGTSGGEEYWQFATAWPIGTALAQTWDEDLVKEVYEAIGKEMVTYGVTMWLAPGMNIHRDPLNGRNFEYYSEDPLLTGLVGAAATLGVQASPGVGVTIKHYAANNQEASRNTSDSVISERALREIYLKGFEISVKAAQPMAVMSSYNKINGTYVAGDYDLLTNILRGEWGFAGLVMTDWGGVRAGIVNCQYAGNDLITPGNAPNDVINALKETQARIDISGLPVYTKTLTQSNNRTTFALQLGSEALNAAGTRTVTTTVNQATVVGQTPLSTYTVVDTINNTTTVPEPASGFATVQAAYDYVNGLLTTAPNNQPFSAAQRNAIQVNNLQYDTATPPALTSFDVTLKLGTASALGYIMRLGDVQRSAAKILEVVAQSIDFERLAEEQDVSGIEVAPYGAQFDNLVTYNAVGKGAVGTAPVLPDPIVSNPASPEVIAALSSLVADAAALKAADYTPASWAAYQAAVAAAQAVLAKAQASKATDADVSAAVAAVLNARIGLAPLAQTPPSSVKPLLQAFVNASVGRVKASYTAASWATFAAALAKAKTVLVKSNASETEIVAAFVALVRADAGLVLVAAAAQTGPNSKPGGDQTANTKPVKQVIKAGKVKITGKAKVGSKLKAKKSGWTKKVKYTYKWYRNGKAIKGAKKATYKVKAADKGKKIKVKVTAKKAGWTTAKKVSKAVKIRKK